MKVGDRIKIIKCSSNPGCCGDKYVGMMATVKKVHSDGSVPAGGLSIDTGTHYWEDYEVQVIGKCKGASMSKKYYRLIKEHPVWEVGAIVQQQDGDKGSYEPVDTIWNKDIFDEEDLTEYKTVVEKTPWFERVYPIGKLEKMMFGTKKQAQAAAEALYKGDK